MEEKESTVTDIHLEKAYTKASNTEGEIFQAVELDQQRFSAWSVIGLQFACSAAPLAICSFTYLVAGVGGTSYFFWCYLVAVIGQLLVTASLAEISAIYPHASGQIFWTVSLGPSKGIHFISYIVGALTFFGWTLGIAGTCVFTGDFLVAFGELVTSSYVGKEWHIFLVACANVVLALILNIACLKLLPGLNKFMVVFLNASAFYMFVVLLAKAHPKASAYDAFIKVVNETGWSSDGLVFLLGFLPGVLTVCLPDASAHMAEEVPNPERTVPLVMFSTAVLNAVAGLVMNITLIFCTVAPENLLEPLAGMPIFQIAKDAWDNHGWVITVGLIMTAVPLNGCISIMTGGSRLLWSFAKCGGILGAKSIGYTNTRLQAPVNAVLATGLLAVLLSFLVFGPSTVLNGIFGSSGICMSVSYWAPIALMMMKDRKTLPEHRYFNLGRWGPVVNAASLVWLSLMIVMLSFPIYQPVTTASMNWAAPVFIGLLLLALVNWLFVRRTYELPKPIFVDSLHGH